ncbi:MAG: hypothetical protein ABEI86_13690 [Halobacteriaceae archaeon]
MDKADQIVPIEFELNSKPAESTIENVPLRDIAQVIVDDIDQEEWEQIADAIRSEVPNRDDDRVQRATADYFLVRDHKRLDLDYIFFEKLNELRIKTIKPIEPGWIDPDPILESSKFSFNK